MAELSQKKIGERLELLRATWWDAVRHHPGYRRDAARTLRRLRRESRQPYDLSTTQDVEFDLEVAIAASQAHPIARQLAAMSVVEAYWRLREAARQRRPSRASGIDHLIAGTTLTLCEVLPEFGTAWPLRMPVPPRLQSVPTELITAPFTKPIQFIDHSQARLRLRIWKPAGLVVLDLLPGVMVHVNPPRHGSDKTAIGTPPRKGRRATGQTATVILRHAGPWVLVSIKNPTHVTSAGLAAALSGFLEKSAVTISRSAQRSHSKMMMVVDLCRRRPRWSRERIAECLGLQDSDDRGPERVSDYQKKYRGVLRRFHLPPLN